MALIWQGVEWGASLPRVVLLHGTADTCALFNNATQFRDALREVGAKVRYRACFSNPSCFFSGIADWDTCF